MPIDFPRSDLILDPAALKGPDASDVVAGADLEGALVQAATAAYGPDASEMFGAGAERELGRELIKNPELLNGRSTFWLPVGSQIDVAASRTAMRRGEDRSTSKSTPSTRHNVDPANGSTDVGSGIRERSRAPP